MEKEALKRRSRREKRRAATEVRGPSSDPPGWRIRHSSVKIPSNSPSHMGRGNCCKQADRKERPHLSSLEERQLKGQHEDREILDRVTHAHEASRRIPKGQLQELEKGVQKQNRTLHDKDSSYEQSPGKESKHSHVNRSLKTFHKVTWDDRCGGPLCFWSKSTEEKVPSCSAPASSGKGDRTEQPGTQGNIQGRKNLATAAPISVERPESLTYKEALLKQPSSQQRKAPLQSSSARQARGPSPALLSFKSRCYRCLGRDHRVRNCHDPFRCTRCYRTGHRARHCPR